MRAATKDVIRVWPTVSRALSVPRKRTEYEDAVRLLDDLIDRVGQDESHPLASLMETLSAVIEAYEQHHVPEFAGDARASLRQLMNERGLTQADLPEVGSQGVVSEVLNGRRRLNVRQIQALSRRFRVSPAVFL